MSVKEKFDIIEKITIPMKSDQELKVIELTEKLALRHGFDRNSIDEMKLAVIEAVINAIEHGRNKERLVYITLGVCLMPLQMTIIISDSGSGFNPDSVQEPDIKNKMHKKERKRGWGLKLMRSMMDEVRIDSSPGSTQVTLVKNG